MRALVTGGAGYVGSVVVEELLAAGAERVVVLDDLSKGHAGAVVPPAALVRGDIGDAPLVEALCRDERIDVVVHMAARSLVGESVAQPAAYYDVNVQRGLRLLDAMLAAGVRRIVFSSTAAVYGEPDSSPITEDFATAPLNPYGETKLAFERALGWYQAAYGLTWASLRYFNAAGATAANGEQHDPESHLVPNVLAVARGAAPAVAVFGDDYPTPDGTCIRDYIHISDLARAHVLAIPALDRLGGRVFNLGCGGGHSVAQVIETARAVTGHPIPVARAPRRSGDPPILVASSDRIRHELGWEARFPDLRDIIATAWVWLQSHPTGYT
ncbi:MAG TPA: UDP-glucose 4-epimerase GalE [Kofleriaceae bacterium]|nr:UDP-glucose 4-epimerase GalE [Kofleriaceae bacterium]